MLERREAPMPGHPPAAETWYHTGPDGWTFSYLPPGVVAGWPRNCRDGGLAVVTDGEAGPVAMLGVGSPAEAVAIVFARHATHW